MIDPKNWPEDLPAAVTVCDTQGTILFLNRAAQETFAADGGSALIGKSLFDCHPASATSKIAEMMRTKNPNHYTISKKGRRKIIHQLPWFENGTLAGLVEISIPIPDQMPHFDRK